jgi:hypothetical protein
MPLPLQAAYGKNALALTSFFTYVGLGLGLLGSSLALPFGLYVLICQRASEKYIQDQVGLQGTYGCLHVPGCVCGCLWVPGCVLCISLLACVWCTALHLVTQQQRSAPYSVSTCTSALWCHVQLRHSGAAQCALLTCTRPAAPQISPAGDYREAATAVAILLAILTLVPMAPELADSVGMGVNDAMFY